MHVLCLDPFTREQRLIVIPVCTDFELPIVSHFILAADRHEHTIDSTFIGSSLEHAMQGTFIQNRCLHE